jgi:hypothetical protein
MPKKRMHFERVPLELVKKVAKEDAHAANEYLPEGPARKSERHNSSDQSLQTEYGWQIPYKHALVELNRSRLGHRIAAAESAMFNRLRMIEGDGDHHAERRAIEDAQRALHVLKRDAVAHPMR